ncbi:MAG: hypothetical protein RL685_6571, partial [Pseudomonadota bacterium]
MRTSHAAAASALLLTLAAQTRIATACVLEPTLPHRSDATLAQIDTAAPQAPVVVAAAAYRRSGLTCGQDVCVANNCGDLGGVAVDLATGRDDHTPSNRLGYRLELVDGEVPEQLRRLLGVNLAGPTPVRVHLAFDQVPTVNARLRIIALDDAGNESAPSQPFEVSFDGCTLAATGDKCEGDYDADREYSERQQAEAATLESAGGAELGQLDTIDTIDVVSASLDPEVQQGIEQGGCSLSGPGSLGARSDNSALGALAGLLLAGF